MKPAMQQALDLLYPPRCPFCGQVLGPLTLCPDCTDAVRKLELTPPRLPQSEFHLGELNNAAAVYRYEGLAREAVLRLKRDRRPDAARWLGARMATIFGCDFAAAYGTIPTTPLPLPVADLIVSAPFSHRRTWQPTRLLALRLGKALQIPVATGLLRKHRDLSPQEGLTASERLRNARRSVQVVDARQAVGRRILLVDDVVTTGGTAADCARALLAAGAVTVDLVCLAAAFPGREE